MPLFLLLNVLPFLLFLQASFHGIESIRKVMETFRQKGQMDLVEGYKGMLIENFRCSRNFFTCVEVSKRLHEQLS